MYTCLRSIANREEIQIQRAIFFFQQQLPTQLQRCDNKPIVAGTLICLHVEFNLGNCSKFF